MKPTAVYRKVEPMPPASQEFLVGEIFLKETLITSRSKDKASQKSVSEKEESIQEKKRHRKPLHLSVTRLGKTILAFAKFSEQSFTRKYRV
jgi:hypothetical protein